MVQIAGEKSLLCNEDCFKKISGIFLVQTGYRYYAILKYGNIKSSE